MKVKPELCWLIILPSVTVLCASLEDDDVIYCNLECVIQWPESATLCDFLFTTSESYFLPSCIAEFGDYDESKHTPQFLNNYVILPSVSPLLLWCLGDPLW